MIKLQKHATHVKFGLIHPTSTYPSFITSFKVKSQKDEVANSYCKYYLITYIHISILFLDFKIHIMFSR